MLVPVDAPPSIAVIGTNYVGLITAAGLAELGHTVVGVDIDPIKIELLQRGQVPIFEPELDDLVARQTAAGRLQFTTDYTSALHGARFAFICVGTPPLPSGAADMAQVRSAADSLAQYTPSGNHLIVVTKSTVPVGTADWLHERLYQTARNLGSDARFGVVSNPEFLREGSAVNDFRQPDRVVLGSSDAWAMDSVAELYDRLALRPPVFKTDVRTAEMIKYASNAFLATKISFINEMALICDAVGADVHELAAGMALDRRIGSSNLSAGVGYGGSCFPKDVRALAHTAAHVGVEPRLLHATDAVNNTMPAYALDRLEAELGDLAGRQIGVLGLAFKRDTDDVRESPAIDIVRQLQARGARVRAYDPAAPATTARMVPGLTVDTDPYAVAHDADALLVLTDWPEFRELDLLRIRGAMRSPVLLDGRNMFDPGVVSGLGFRYLGVGRSFAEYGPGVQKAA